MSAWSHRQRPNAFGEMDVLASVGRFSTHSNLPGTRHPLSTNTTIIATSAPANLPLRNRSHPTESQIQTDHHNPQDPETLLILTPMKAKENGEYDTTQIPRRARKPTNNPIRMRIHMRHQPEIRPIPGLQKKRHPRDQPKHGGFIAGVSKADGDVESSRNDAYEDDPALFHPEGFGVAVEEVGDDASQGTGDDVEEAEHGGPLAGVGLAEGGEVAEVVRCEV
jgi:hypothetical protein